jgi:hypothetical protein
VDTCGSTRLQITLFSAILIAVVVDLFSRFPDQAEATNNLLRNLTNIMLYVNNVTALPPALLPADSDGGSIDKSKFWVALVWFACLAVTVGGSSSLQQLRELKLSDLSWCRLSSISVIRSAF